MYRLCYIKNLFYFADKGMAQGNMAGPERYIILEGIVSHYATASYSSYWSKECETNVLDVKIDFT